MSRSIEDFQQLSTETPDDPRWHLVHRIAASPHLRSSTRLREFLLYVTDCALRNAPEEATEQQIGIHVFGRLAGYNSSEDSVVRSQARLLRQKLTAYFAAEGASEDLRVEIPKGQYTPVFRSLSTSEEPGMGLTSTEILAATPPPATPSVLQVPSLNPRRFHPALLALALVAALAVGAAAALWWSGPRVPRPAREVQALWAPFFSAEPPLVIYSNALFVGDSKTGLRIVASDDDPAAASAPRHDFYTGVGEVVAVHELTQLFQAARSSFILKRSRLVTWDEAQSRNLIFIGAQSQNTALKALPSAADFNILATPDTAGITNAHPRPGEPALFSRPNYPLTTDYAIISLRPGPQTGKWIMALTGLTTLGTEAATGFVTRPESAAQLLRPATQPNGKLHPFEAVLQMSVNSGVPLQPRLAALHVH